MREEIAIQRPAALHKLPGFTAVSSIATRAIRSENNFLPTRYTNATAPEEISTIGRRTVTVLNPNSLIKGTMQ